MNLPPLLRFQYSNNSGPLAGGQLFTYAAGTSIPQATYTDSTGNTPNTNPVVLDANGSASVWADPTLSYKYVLMDASGNTLFTQDNVVGILTANAVNTASLQNLSVTTAKMALNSVTSAILQSDAAIDANRAVGTNHIQNSAVSRPKLGSGIYLAPNIQTFLTAGGSGTYGLTYVFFCSSANATAGATYVNNSVTYTVQKTISGSVFLYAAGPGAPLPSGTLSKASGTGDTNITFTSYVTPLYLKVKMVGAGGGGGGTGSGSGGGAGGVGGNTTFGSLFLTANGGGGGQCDSGGAASGGAQNGGTVSLGTGAIQLVAIQGATGGPPASNYTTGANGGGLGGATPFAGAGAGGFANTAPGSGVNSPTPGIANSGSGGGGGGGSGTVYGSSGGAAGGYIEALITAPAVSYAYAIGTGGPGGTAGTSGSVGAAGGSGCIIVEELYQ